MYLGNAYPEVNDVGTSAQPINLENGRLDPIPEPFVDGGKLGNVFDTLPRLSFYPTQTLLWTDSGV